jgi:protein-tyrosine phosphatase
LPSSRVHTPEGAYNLRDLGGLRTAAGLMVRTGRVFRGDYPRFVDIGGASAVRELGIRTVVDLRRGTEAAVECVDWNGVGVEYQRCPLAARERSSWHVGYTAYLRDRPQTVIAAVAGVMRPAGHGTLFHCAAGKDRTGVVAALLLAVLGVSSDAIVEDYLLSDGAVGPILARLVEMEVYAEMLASTDRDEQRPRAERMWELLEWIDQRGGAESWLLDNGLDPTVVADFRVAMLPSRQEPLLKGSDHSNL